ncbi:MAG: DUF6152 family protein [Acidobacteriota bacterium]
MTFRLVRVFAPALAVSVLAAAVTVAAHHEILAKFDDKKPLTLSGVVTLVDWRNPHVHVFMDVRDQKSQMLNWAIELESPIDLQRSGWNKDSLKPGDKITVEGMAARNGSRQAWGKSVVLGGTGRQVLTVSLATPPPPLSPRPTPRWPDRQPRLGAAAAGGAQGYWAYPSSTALVESGVNVPMSTYGLLQNIADASKVAPMQPWARALYTERQRRFLQDDPMYLNCKPPGGPRQFQLSYGVQFVEDRDHQRIFVLIGSGNSNYRIIYSDGRGQKGQVGGDDDNPLYYGRSVAKWDGDTFVVDTTGFNEDFWFTNGGLPHTDQLHLVERFTRTDFDTLKYDVTIEDQGAYTRPWSSSSTLRWVAGEDLPRHICQENRS